MNRHNSWWLSGLLAVWLGNIGFSSAFGADAASPLEKIVVSKGVVYSCSYGKQPLLALTTEKWQGIFLHSWNLGLAKAACSQELGVTVDSNLRWSVAHQHFWATDAQEAFASSMRYHCNRVAFDPKTGFPDPTQAITLAQLTPVQPLDDLAWIGMLYSKFPFKLHYDYLADSDTKFQVFILTNVRGRYENVIKPDLGKVRSLSITQEEMKTPKWSLTVFSNTVTPMTGEKSEWGDWKQVETITPLFEEEFQVVARADTYYFLTKSGKVYQSKKPDKGKERTIQALWTDKEQPVVTFVQDADNNRTFAFTKNKKQGEKDVYFELADKPKPQPYNLADVKPPKYLREPLKTALPYAKILLADGKIKAPKPKK